MTDLYALARDNGPARDLTTLDAIILASIQRTAADSGSISIGTDANTTSIDIGSGGLGGTVTTIRGDFAVVGATTLVSASTLEGDVNIGDGGNTITIGGDPAGVGAGDVIYLGTEDSVGTNDSEVTLRTLMTVDGNTYSGRIVGDTADIDFSDNKSGIIIPNVAEGSAAFVTTGSIIQDGTDFKWYNGASWSVAATTVGSTLDAAYNAGNTITVDAAGGDMKFLITGGAADKFRIAEDTEAQYIDFEATVAAQLTFNATIQSFDLVVAEASDTAITIDASAGGMLITPSGAYSCVFDVEDCTGTSDGFIVQDSSGELRYFEFLHEGVATASIYSKVTDWDNNVLNDLDWLVGNDETHTITGVLTLAAATVDIDATTSGATIDAAKGISLDAIQNSNFSVTDNSASNWTLTLSCTNAGAGAGHIDITASDNLTLSCAYLDLDATGAAGIDIDATIAGFSIDGVTSSNVSITDNSASNRKLTLSASNAGGGRGDVDVTASDTMTISGIYVDIDATGAAGIAIDATIAGFSIDGVTDSNVSVTDNSASNRSLTISASNAGVGRADIIIAASDELDIDCGVATLDIVDYGITITGGVSGGRADHVVTISNPSPAYLALNMEGAGTRAAGGIDGTHQFVTLAINSIAATQTTQVGTYATGAIGSTSTDDLLSKLTSKRDTATAGDVHTDISADIDNASASGDALITVDCQQDGTGQADIQITCDITAAGNAQNSTILIEATTNGSGQANVDVNAGYNITLDAQHSISLGAIYDSDFTIIAGAGEAANRTLTFEVDHNGSVSGDATIVLLASSVSGTAYIDGDADVITLDSAAGMSLDAGAASNFTTSAGALTLSGAGGLALVSGANNDISLTPGGTGKIDLNGAQLIKKTVVNVAAYSTTGSDYLLHVTRTATGVCTVTLQTADCVDERVIRIVDAGGNASTFNITIDTQGAETIAGAASQTIDADYNALTLYSDGSNWFVM